ncbi:MAG: hypothetical protein K8H89_04460 [Flavobacteriales bacterium]|jgi:uncharacterized delta-60 repeat protein|nr:hypothetical protein [Flavobacteriales bacterium]
MNYTSLCVLPLFLLPFTSTGQYGELDMSFGPTGYAITGQAMGNSAVNKLIHQADGDILVSTLGPISIQTDLLSSVAVADPEWYTYAHTAMAYPTGNIVERPDGKVVVAVMGLTAANDLRLLRYATNSELDPGFGTDGVVLHPFPDVDQVHVSAMELLPDGRMVLAGSVRDSSSERVLVGRFHEDGSLDPTFNGTGLLFLDVGDATVAEDLLLLPDGGILIGGYSMESGTKHMLLARLLANGELDGSFGTDGMVDLDLGYSAQAIQGMALAPGGAIVAAGWVERSETDTDAFLGMFSTMGQLDPGFGTNGWLLVDVAAGLDRYNDVLLDRDDLILTCGEAWPAGMPQATITRRTLSGTPDPTFGTDGTAMTEFEFGGSGTCLALQADGKVLLGGSWAGGLYTYGMVARFTAGTYSGIATREAAAPLVVVPNPATELIQLTLPDPGHAFELRIHDAIGRIVGRGQLGTTRPSVVDVHGLAEGAYQLVLSDGPQVYRASFVIAR